MNICVVIKGRLEALPAVMAVTIVIRELGYNVEVITSKSQNQTKVSFGKKGIDIIDVMPHMKITRSSILKKLHTWLTFSKRVCHHIEKNNKDTLLWIASADTALALGKKLLQQHYVLQIRELYDTHLLYRRALTQYVHKASCIVVPEICRAAIFRSWYKLKETPIVLPNKPCRHPRRKNLEIEDERAKTAFESLTCEVKIVLYQGHIGYDRDVTLVAEVVQTMASGWRFVAMGPSHEDYLDKLKKNCPNIIYIQYGSMQALAYL